MAYPTKDSFTFDHEVQLTYPGWTDEQTKQNMNARGEELRLALNAVVELLNATTDGTSGADSLGIPETIAGSGTSVRDRADWLYTQIANVILGQVADASLTDAKLSDEAGQIKDRLVTHVVDDTRHITGGVLGTKLSVKTGAISHGGTIPQTAGYSNYLYLVSPNTLYAYNNTEYSASSDGTGVDIRCSVADRLVTCQIRVYSAGLGWSELAGGTANYIEIAW